MTKPNATIPHINNSGRPIDLRPREEVHLQGLLHESVLALLTIHGKIALLRRPMEKATYPGCWDIFGGQPEYETLALIPPGSEQRGQDTMQRRRPAARRERDLASGPGKLCAAFDVTRRHNGLDLTKPPLYLEDRGERPKDIATSPRIGVDYAGEWAKKPWRFYFPANPHVSRR